LLITDQLNSNSPRQADSAVLVYLEEIRAIYSGRDYKPVWSDKLDWLPVGDSLFSFIQSSRLFGFFPEDYHFNEISAVRDRFIADSAGKDALRDAWLWSKADMLLTDAFVGILHDIKLGRLPGDSITLRKDTALNPGFYIEQLTALLGGQAITGIVSSLEPKQRGYHDIRKGIPAFLSKATNKEFTKVPLRAKDPAGFKTLLQKRLFEEGYISFDSIPADSSTLASSIKKYQQDKGLAVDGVAGDGTVRTLNTSDREKFIRIAISLDKFKLLPEEMPGKYIWVNVPGYSMDVVEEDTVRFSSKIICGKAKTQTPLLNGAISVLITYPQWVPPPSIVKKEILPAVRKNPDYLARKGFSLVDSKGEVVDPYSVDWSKYTNMPYRVVQGSGDANALGIMKFHFDNKYSVYLHDTNQRYLFANAMRSLSHGCVRVQEWEKLTYYLLRNDSIASGRSSRIDSVKTWLQNKQKRHVALRNKMPVYIRYITCEGKDGGIVFYDDPYGTDQLLRDRYFAGK
jgi:murein L,D-transpeptidase YcbB/YkuD